MTEAKDNEILRLKAKIASQEKELAELRAMNEMLIKAQARKVSAKDRDLPPPTGNF